MERTLVLIKPDAIQRGIIGDITTRFEKAGLKIIGAKMVVPGEDLANKHYPNSRKEFITGLGMNTLRSCKAQGINVKKQFGTDDPHKIGLKVQKWLVDFIVSDPVLALVLEAPHAIEIVRKLAGTTLPTLAPPGSIRGDYSFDSAALANSNQRTIRNLIHASGDMNEAEFEINLWFNQDELFDYQTVHQQHMLNESKVNRQKSQ